MSLPEVRELVRRLREYSAFPIDNWPTGTMAEAADRIEAADDLFQAAKECADWHMAQLSNHVTDINLRNAVFRYQDPDFVECPKCRIERDVRIRQDREHHYRDHGKPA